MVSNREFSWIPVKYKDLVFDSLLDFRYVHMKLNAAALRLVLKFRPGPSGLGYRFFVLFAEMENQRGDKL